MAPSDDRPQERRSDPAIGQVTSEKPEPAEDPVPDHAPGGSDAPDPRNAPEAPQEADTPWGEPLTTDQPRSAQVQDDDVPDAVEEGEDTGEPITDDEGTPSTEEPA